MNTRRTNRFLCATLLIALLSTTLLAQEQAVTALSDSDQEAFVKAVSLGDDESVQDWLSKKPDLEFVSEMGVTAMEVAKIRGYANIVELLRAAGAKDEPVDSVRIVSARLNEFVKPDRPGVAILVKKGDETLFQFTGGMADLSHDVPIKLDTKFRIGSVTKQFAATAILKLQEEGKLAVTDTLDKFIPDFPRGNEVTIHHLLTHTSGIKSFTSLPGFMADVPKTVSDEEVIETFRDEPYDFDPGEKFLYNNSGYFLLGVIIEKVSGLTFGEYLEAEVFDKLGMGNSGIHDSSEIIRDEARGYSSIDGEMQKARSWDMSWAGAAGNIYSTVGDLVAWNEGLFADKLINEASRAAAFTPVKVRDGSQNNYGYGWLSDEYRGLKRVSHSGGLNGFLSQLTYFPEHEVTIAVLHNASPHVPGLNPNQIGEQLVDFFLWDLLSPQEAAKVDDEADSSTFADYVGQYDYRGAIMTVTQDGDKLNAQLTGQPKFQIFPKADAEGTFVWKVVRAEVKFLRDDEGNVTGARHSQGGATFDAPRFESGQEIEVAEEILDRYVGKYRYPGLGTLVVRRDGKQLLAKMTGQPEFELFASTESKFFWKVVRAEIEFTVNDENRVTGAVHTQAGNTLNVSRVDD